MDEQVQIEEVLRSDEIMINKNKAIIRLANVHEGATLNSSQGSSSSLPVIPVRSIIPVMSVSHVFLSPYVQS